MKVWSLVLACACLAFAVGACKDSFRFDDADAGARDAARPGPCAEDSECELATLHCELASGACVECTADEHCAGGERARCDVGMRRCVACLESGDCAAGEVCEPHTHACLPGCSSLDDCPADSIECDDEHGFCESCERRADCAGTPETPVCEPRVERCVECVSHTDCAGTTPRCDPLSARCVACIDSSDCPSAQPYCDPRSHACVRGD